MTLRSPATAVSSGHGKPKRVLALGSRLSFTLLFCAHGRREYGFLSKQLVTTAQRSALSSKPCLSFLLCSWERTGKQQSTVRDTHTLMLRTGTKAAATDCPVGSWVGCRIAKYREQQMCSLRGSQLGRVPLRGRLRAHTDQPYLPSAARNQVRKENVKLER